MSHRGYFHPRVIDRSIILILALLHISSGAYLVGPWYLDESQFDKTPLYAVLHDNRMVAAYGTLLLIDGFFLAYASVAGAGRVNTFITANALLAGFLLRLYALIGVFLTLDSWRPPSYLSSIATICILGAMWVWVRVDERTV